MSIKDLRLDLRFAYKRLRFEEKNEDLRFEIGLFITDLNLFLEKFEI